MDKPVKSKQPKVYKPSAQEVKKRYSTWRSWYANNDETALKGIMFGLIGDQWDQTQVSRRTTNNKESLASNLCLKHLRRIEAQSKEIEFSLNVSPLTESDDAAQTAIFRAMMNTWVLSDDVLNTGSDSLDKCLEYGYAVAEVGYKRQSDDDLCLVPHIKLHRDPSVAFFDRNAIHACKIDGNFCGLRKIVSEAEIERKLPDLFKDKKSTGWILKDGNEWIDYWYRVWVPATFVRLPTNIYKREDLLTEEEKASLKDENGKPITFDDDKPLTKTGNICKIYYRAYCNDRVVGEPKLYPSDDLPLAYHPGMTFWTPEGEYTYPFITPFMDTQKLHNYLISQIATMAKNSSSTKWIGTPDMASEESWAMALKEINTREGAIIIGKDRDGKELRREDPMELPQSLIQMAQVTKQEIDEIAGAMIDTQNAQQTVLAGTALEKITHNMELLQAPIMAKHVLFMRTLGKLVGQMIPKLYTEERTVVVKKKDGMTQAIRINKRLVTGKLENNIKDLSNKYLYEITAGPSSEMQKQNDLQMLQQAYAIPNIGPQIAANTADIYMKLLNSNESQLIARRVAPLVNPLLKKYSDGEISEEEFRMAMQQEQEKAKQEAMNNPEAQAMATAAQAEVMKAQAAQKSAEAKVAQMQMDYQAKMIELEIEKQRLVKEAVEAEQKMQLQLFEIMANNENNQRDREVELLTAQLDRQHQLVQGLMNNAKQERTDNDSNRQRDAA